MSEPDPHSIANDGKSATDSWFGIQDARTRKTVQDRLAQRARRKRLAESKARATASKITLTRPPKLAPKGVGSLLGRSEVTPLSGVSQVSTEVTNHSVAEINSTPLEVQCAEAQLSLEKRFQCVSAVVSACHPGTDRAFLNMPSFTIFSAMFSHGRLLGLSCLYPEPRQSPPPTVDIPLPLHPVPLQMEFPHLPYIDCLPQPKLRHNLILFHGLFDDEAFCFDLISSFHFVVGNESWDPKGWVITEEFKQKWAVVFD